MGGAIASPSPPTSTTGTCCRIGQSLWLKELKTYQQFPPMQDPETYNLTQVMDQLKKAHIAGHAGE